jgi:hypothetical protein
LLLPELLAFFGDAGGFGFQVGCTFLQFGNLTLGGRSPAG